MTIAQTAKALGLKIRTIREWIKTGRLKAEKRGKQWYIDDDVLQDKEVQKRANKGREHSRRIKECAEMGMLARRSKNTKKPIQRAECEE